MRMSVVIEQRLNSEERPVKNICFSRGKAFYEFKWNEDLRFYRDVVYLTEIQANEISKVSVKH